MRDFYPQRGNAGTPVFGYQLGDYRLPINHKPDRFANFFLYVVSAVVFNSLAIAKDRDTSQDDCTHNLIDTPERMLDLLREQELVKLTQFVFAACDKYLDNAE